jgi:hypothetical protein
MLARIQAGQAASDPPVGLRLPRWRRAVGLAATVAAVLGVGVAVNRVAVRSDAPLSDAARPTAAVSPNSTTTGTVPLVASNHNPPGRPISTVHLLRSPIAPAGDARFQQGFLWSAGTVDVHSVDTWSQSDVKLRTTAVLTTMEVRIRIARTPDLTNTGAWTTMPNEDVTMTVDQQQNALVYRFVLTPGASLRPGEYTFAAQYNHATGGRDASRDTYQAIATGDETRVEVAGRF